LRGFQNRKKFGSLIEWALLYTRAKIGELWLRESPLVPKY